MHQIVTSSLFVTMSTCLLILKQEAVPSRVNSLDFSRTDDLLVTASDDDSIRMYNIASGTSLYVQHSRKYGVQNVNFTHSNEAVIYASKRVGGLSTTGHGVLATNSYDFPERNDRCIMQHFFWQEGVANLTHSKATRLSVLSPKSAAVSEVWGGVHL